MHIKVDGGWTDGIGDGWASLVQPLIDQCNKEGVKIIQVKEKFGGLRFYTDRGSPELEKAISDAENRSFDICEDCGSEQSVTVAPRTGRYWTKTLCAACRAGA